MLAGVNDRALTELGKHAQAKADLAEAARLQPSNRVVRTALRGVKRALGAQQEGRLSEEGERQLANGLAKMIG